MSEQTIPLTYEGILELFRETREQMKETDRKFQMQTQETDRRIQETAAQMKESERRMKKSERILNRKLQETWEQIRQTNKDVGGLTSSIGNIIAAMFKGNIVEKFEALGYNELNDYCQKKEFKNKKLGIKGEIDLFIENGDIAILVEVKTTLETKDVRNHIERLEKFRRYTDARGVDKRRFIGAVAGAVIDGDAADVALENGLYVIVQSGEAVEILPQPEGFVAKKW